MRESEALALVAVLQAAFPTAGGGEPTARLYATRLEPHDARVAAKAIDLLIEHREDTRWPSWALIARTIRETRPARVQIDEPAPPPEERAAIRRSLAELVRRHRVQPIDAEAEAAEVRRKQQLARDELARLGGDA